MSLIRLCSHKAGSLIKGVVIDANQDVKGKRVVELELRLSKHVPRQLSVAR